MHLKKLNKDIYQEVVSSSEKNEYLKRLDEMEKWLEDHDDEYNSYITKLDSLKEIFSPIDIRRRSSEECAQATRDFENHINIEKASANSLQNIEILGAVYIECTRADEWLKAWRNLHELLPKTIDKGQLICVIRDRKMALQESCQLIHNNYQTWRSTISTSRPQASYPFAEKDQEHISPKHSVEVGNKRNVDKDKNSAIIDLLFGAFLHRVAVISLQKHHKDIVNEECTRVEQWFMSKIKEQDAVFSSSQIREEIYKLNRICEDQLKQATTLTDPGNKESTFKDRGITGVQPPVLFQQPSSSNPNSHLYIVSNKNPRVYLNIKIGEIMVGRMVFELFMDVVPKTAQNFLALCTGENHVSYVGSLIHRVVPGELCQGGVYTKGQGAIYGVPSFAQENFVKKHTRRGLLSMTTTAGAPKMSHGTGFIICFRNFPELDDKYVVFGEITEGMGVLDHIEAVGGMQKDVPKEKVVIVHCGQLN